MDERGDFWGAGARRNKDLEVGENRDRCECVLRWQDFRAEVGGGWEDPSRKERGSRLGWTAESKRWGGLWEVIEEK